MERRRTDLSLLIVACFLWISLLLCGLTRGEAISTDEVYAYEATRSLFIHGNASVSDCEPESVVTGRGGLSYTPVNSGQSLASLPLYALGEAVQVTCVNVHHPEWAIFFGGAPQQRNGVVWSGECELTFAFLYNAFVVALLGCVFLAFSLRLGASLRGALAATVCLTCSSFVAGYSSTQFTQPIEALGMLWSAYFLFCDRLEPSAVSRSAAGLVVAWTLQCRYPALIIVPGLLLYHGRVVWQRERSLRQMLPFLSMLLVAMLLHAADQYWKFGTIKSQAAYANPHYNSPLLRGLTAFLFSPGDSVFLYTPLLLLAPLWLRDFWKRHRLESVFIMGQTVFYLIIFSKFENWHGLWSYGPRYTYPLVPLLMLPLGGWLTRGGRSARRATILLALLGAAAAFAHLAANFWVVAYWAGLTGRRPSWAFYFEPANSQMLLQFKALASWDNRVDFWMARTYRDYGKLAGRLVLLPWLLGLGTLAALVRRQVGRLEANPDRSLTFVGCVRPVALALLLLLATVGMLVFDRTAVGVNRDDCLMANGLQSLYHRDPTRAADYFRIVLQRNPDHVGAINQLALALDAAGHHPEAIPVWQDLLRRATASGDGATAQRAQAHLR